MHYKQLPEPNMNEEIAKAILKACQMHFDRMRSMSFGKVINWQEPPPMLKGTTHIILLKINS